ILDGEPEPGLLDEVAATQALAQAGDRPAAVAPGPRRLERGFRDVGREDGEGRPRRLEAPACQHDEGRPLPSGGAAGPPDPRPASARVDAPTPVDSPELALVAQEGGLLDGHLVEQTLDERGPAEWLAGKAEEPLRVLSRDDTRNRRLERAALRRPDRDS